MKNNKRVNVMVLLILILMIGTSCKPIDKNKKKPLQSNSQEIPDKEKQEKKIEVINRNFENMTIKHNDKGIPVLMYHSVDFEKGNELRIPKEQFREQMTYLKDNGYTTLTLKELQDFLINNKVIPEKSVVITLDDGYVDNYTNAYPVLKELGLYATIFAITSNIDKDKRSITSEQIKEMEKDGVYVESHTVNHDELEKLDYQQQLKTMKDSKDVLQKISGRKIDYIAYPYGKFNKETIKAAQEAGYTMAVTTNGAWSNKEDGIYTLDRVYISANYSMEEFKRRITNPNFNKK